MQKRVRAIIVQNDSLVLIHRKKAEREYWVFPGGGLEDSDTSPQSGLERECLEELGVTVDVIEQFAEIPSSPPVTDGPEIFFICRIVSGELGTGHGPEFTRDEKLSGTYTIQQIPLRLLPEKSIFPTEVRDMVIKYAW